MITDALITFTLASFRAIVGLLPAWVVPVPALSAMSGFVGDAAARADGYFPVLTTIVCAGVVLTVRVGLLAWRVVIFVYHQFWGSN